MLRAIAAICVVQHHAIHLLDIRFFGMRLSSDYSLGGRGVQLFFVLSGFIIYRVHRHDPQGIASFLAYARKRIFRIVPITFVVATGWALVLLLLGRLGLPDEGASFATWLSSAFILLPFDTPRPVVIWTLRHELAFYAIFAILFFSRAGFLAAMGAWTVAAFLLRAENSDDATGWQVVLTLLGSDTNVLFGLGVIAALSMRDGREGPDLTKAFLLSIVGLVLLGLRFGTADYGAAETLLFGLASAVAIYCAAHAKIASPRLVLLGDASFSIYLVHYPALFLLSPIAALFPASTYPLAFAVLVALATAVGLLFHFRVERPLLAALNRGGQRRPAIV